MGKFGKVLPFFRGEANVRRSMIMKKTLLLAAVLAALAFVGCASHGGHSVGHGTGCRHCVCQAMVIDSANPGKCQMCGHSEAEHQPATPAKDAHSAHH